MNAYNKLYTVDTGRGELVYLGSKLVPPRNARAGIIDTAHQGHFSPETIYNDLRKFYFWPEMKTVVEAKAKACNSCRRHKKSKTRQQPFVPLELQAFEVGECWSVDIMSIGKMDFLVCVDRVSQYMMLEKLPNKTGKACTKALRKWTTFLGIPTILRSDGGPAFDCNLMTEFCKSLGIVHVLTSAYHAPSNGQCERMVQEVRKFMEKSGERDPELVMKVLNNTERRGGLGTPMKIMMGRNVKGPLPNSQNEDLNIYENLQKRFEMADKIAKQKGRFNRETFEEGDEVWIQNPKDRKWDRKGIVHKVRKWNGVPLSYLVMSDGKEYLRNGKFLCHTVPKDEKKWVMFWVSIL